MMPEGPCDVCSVTDAEVEDDGLFVCQPCVERLRKHEARRPK